MSETWCPSLAVAFALVVGSSVLALDNVRLLPGRFYCGRSATRAKRAAIARDGLARTAALAVFAGTVRRALIGVAIANVVFVLGVAVQSRTPVTEHVRSPALCRCPPPEAQRPDRHDAKITRRVRISARLRKPVIEVVRLEELSEWLAANPSGVGIVRSRIGERTVATPQNPIVFSRSYRVKKS